MDVAAAGADVFIIFCFISAAVFNEVAIIDFLSRRNFWGLHPLFEPAG